MKIVKYVKKSKDKYQLFMDNGEVIDTYLEVIINNNLLYDKDVDLVKYDNIIKENEIQRLYNDCLKHIKARLRSEKEIVSFLEKKKVDEVLGAIVVNKLKTNNLINDEYFCQCYIHDKLNFSMQGEYKIVNELRKLGISEEIISNNYYLFDREILQEKIDKLIGKYLKSNKKQKGLVLKNKVYTNLMNQGFAKEMILNMLNKYDFNE